MDNEDEKDAQQPMTSKFSEFLRTFQHHRTLSLLCIDEVRPRLSSRSKHKKTTHVLCNLKLRHHPQSSLCESEISEKIYDTQGACTTQRRFQKPVN